MGSSRHVDDFDEEIRKVSSGGPIGVKDSKSAPCCGGVTEVVILKELQGHGGGGDFLLL